MRRATIAGGAFATAVVLLAVAASYRAFEQDADPAAAASPPITPSTAPAAAETYQGFLYGRITTVAVLLRERGREPKCDVHLAWLDELERGTESSHEALLREARADASREVRILRRWAICHAGETSPPSFFLDYAPTEYQLPS